MWSTLLWDITQRWVVLLYRRFGTTYPPHFQGSRSQKKLLGLVDFFSHAFLISALDGVEFLASRPNRFTLRWKRCRRTLNRILGGTQCWSRHHGEEKGFLYLPEMKSLRGRPAPNLVHIPIIYSEITVHKTPTKCTSLYHFIIFH
jgi:hypothetical protein